MLISYENNVIFSNKLFQTVRKWFYPYLLHDHGNIFGKVRKMAEGVFGWY